MNAELKKPLAEIKAILDKHDLAGIVVVANRTHTDYVLNITPTWTCARWEGEILRIRALRKDFSSKEEQRKVVAATAGMLMGMIDTHQRIKDSLTSVVMAIGKTVSIEHKSTYEGPESGCDILPL